MAAKVQPHVLNKFIRATTSVYGPIDTLTASETTTWTPPPMAEGHRGRYLWTDAFGVLNLLTLSALTSDPRYTTLATRLIAAVHGTLGRTRDGAARLPGASETHPLGGGLRIGKDADEDDPSGDGDGQYHHYLTLWMFALHGVARATGERRYNDLAIELARAIHPRFVRDRDSLRPRMCWKMSVDLSRALVRSEGNLDPIGGYVVFNLLQRANEGDDKVLEREIGEYKRMLETKWRGYVSDDPLYLGMTLWTAHWFDGREEWAAELSRRAVACLHALDEEKEYFAQPAKFRLAFREFGTCLGVRRRLALAQHADRKPASSDPAEEAGAHWEAFVEKLLTTWAPNLEESPGLIPRKLRPITLVMYAAALVPGGT